MNDVSKSVTDNLKKKRRSIEDRLNLMNKMLTPDVPPVTPKKKKKPIREVLTRPFDHINEEYDRWDDDIDE